jgi:hypothetical protein
MIHYSLSKKITRSHLNKFDVLKVKILFYTMINMMIIFHFIIIMLKTPILKVDLNGFFKEACDIGLKTILTSHFQCIFNSFL